MPIYEYQCKKCGLFEVMQKITETHLKRCPTCRGKVTKLISNSSFHLKGTGWYVTDYANKDGKSKDSSSESKDSKAESSAAAADTKSKSETSDGKSSKSETKDSKAGQRTSSDTKSSKSDTKASASKEATAA